METTKFETGAVRSADRAKVRYDLISPIGLRRVAETCHEGAEKYSDFNWEKGMPVHDILNHAIAHLYQYLSGDRTEDHLAHAAWNCFAAMHSEEVWPNLNVGTLRLAGCKPPGPLDWEDDRPTEVSTECPHCHEPAHARGTPCPKQISERAARVTPHMSDAEMDLLVEQLGGPQLDITHGPVRHNAATSSNPAMVPTPPVTPPVTVSER